MNYFDEYFMAQKAIAGLKAAIYGILSKADGDLSNAEIGRALGIYAGHVRHEGHIPRTLLAMLESEGVAEQDATTKRWRLITPITVETDIPANSDI